MATDHNACNIPSCLLPLFHGLMLPSELDRLSPVDETSREVGSAQGGRASRLLVRRSLNSELSQVNPSRHQGKLGQNSQDGKMVEKAAETEWDGAMSVGRWAGSYHDNHVRRILCIPRSQLGWGYEVELLLIVDSKILNPNGKKGNWFNLTTGSWIFKVTTLNCYWVSVE